MLDVKKIKRDYKISHVTKWFVLAVLVGIVAGFGSVIFTWAIKITQEFAIEKFAHYRFPIPFGEAGRETVSFVRGDPFLLFISIAIGGLITGLLIFNFAPEAAGHGTDAVIKAFHRYRGYVRPIVPVIKTIASAITIGTGGSAGREGPIAQIGSGFGSYLATKLKLSDRDRRILLIAGVGGGIGSIFRAPLGGALFSVEVLYKGADVETEAVIPSIISAIVAYAVFGFFATWNPIFITPKYRFNVVDLIYFAIIGVTVVPLAYLYVKTFYFTEEKFKKLRAPAIFKPMIGAALVGIILVFLPHVAGTSYGWLQLAMLGKIGIWMMLFISLGKIVATSLTIGSGGSGGVFAPSLVIGGMFAGMIGKVFVHLDPRITDISPFILVGMGAFFAAAAKVPIATIVMVAEMTGNYDLLVPITLAASLAFLISGDWTIYHEQVQTRFDSPAHRGEFIIDILEDIKVKDALSSPQKNVIEIPEDMKVKDALKKAALRKIACFPVISRSGELKGVLYTDDLRSVVFGGELENLKDILIVGDVVRDNIPYLTPEDSLQKALSIFIKEGVDALPVVSEDRKKCIGILTRHDVMSTYDKEMVKRVERNV